MLTGSNDHGQDLLICASICPHLQHDTQLEVHACTDALLQGDHRHHKYCKHAQTLMLASCLGISWALTCAACLNAAAQWSQQAMLGRTEETQTRAMPTMQVSLQKSADLCGLIPHTLNDHRPVAIHRQHPLAAEFMQMQSTFQHDPATVLEAFAC